MRARLGEQSSKWWRDGTSSIQAVVICAIACGFTARAICGIHQSVARMPHLKRPQRFCFAVVKS